jgi:hypothetical protein
LANLSPAAAVLLAIAVNDTPIAVKAVAEIVAAFAVARAYDYFNIISHISILTLLSFLEFVDLF